MLGGELTKEERNSREHVVLTTHAIKQRGVTKTQEAVSNSQCEL